MFASESIIKVWKFVCKPDGWFHFQWSFQSTKKPVLHSLWSHKISIKLAMNQQSRKTLNLVK